MKARDRSRHPVAERSIALCQQGRDLPQKRLEAHAAILEVGLLGGNEHRIVREQPGERDGIREGAAGHDGGQKRACVQIARAVEHVRHEFVLRFEETGICSCDEIPDETIAALDALQDHVLRAAREQRIDDAMRLVVGDVLPAPRIADRLA